MPKITKDTIDILFDYGVDQTNRRIFLLGDIEQKHFRQIIEGIFLLQSANREKPIEIYVGTLGGDAYEMFGLYDVIRNCASHIITIGIGMVMSAGPLILAAGDERKAFPNTSFMVHEGWYSIYDQKECEHETALKHSKDLSKRWARRMEDRTGTSSKIWTRMCKNRPDDFFDVDTAKTLGIIDEIINSEES